MIENKIISLVKKELINFKRLINPDYPAHSEKEDDDDEGQSKVREGLLKFTLHILRKMDQTEVANTLQTSKRVINVYLSLLP